MVLKKSVDHDYNLVAPYLPDDPAVEDGPVAGRVVLADRQEVLVREDGLVLSHDVKQVHATQLDGLSDVLVSCNNNKVV